MTPSVFGIGTLGTLLDVAALRHKVIAQNVANVNTPGYHRLEVSFEKELAKVVEGAGPERQDGNTVDIDREMGDLTKNGLLYQAAAQIVASKMASMKSAISGR